MSAVSDSCVAKRSRSGRWPRSWEIPSDTATFKEEARPKPGWDRAAYKKAPRPFVISGPASLITPSWNQVVAFLTDWEGLRGLAAWGQTACPRKVRSDECSAARIVHA